MSMFKPSPHVNFGRKTKARIVDEDDDDVVAPAPKAKASKSSTGKPDKEKKKVKEQQLLLPPPDQEMSSDEDPEPTDEDQDDSVYEGGNSEQDGHYPVPVLQGVDKKTLRKLNTMFGQRSGTIISMLETEETDSALLMISRTLLQTMVDVLPVLERNVRRTRGQRGVYQMNQVISQIREMCHDIQAYKDRANVGANTVERFIRPGFLDIAVQLTTAFVELEERARPKMKAADFDDYKANTLLPLKKGLAEYIMRQYGEIQTGVIKSFG